MCNLLVSVDFEKLTRLLSATDGGAAALRGIGSVHRIQVSVKGLLAPGRCDSVKQRLLQLTRRRLGSPGSSLNPVSASSRFR
mmetsp:Transcript_7669/g.15828  ORF Transcript_7669/g.15828 Transcript_7669/m.15828 type:complete len:82 (-) Transcript_7669:647-892(-)